jgi:hypothetical protein
MRRDRLLPAAPTGLEKERSEICMTCHRLKTIGTSLERQEDAIELSREDTKVPERCGKLAKTTAKLSLYK